MLQSAAKDAVSASVKYPAIRLPQVADTAAALRLGEVSAWGRPDEA